MSRCDCFHRSHLLAGILFLSSVPGFAEEVVVAEGGRARLPIVIPADAGETLRETASDLATQLQRISGADFEIREQPSTPSLSLVRSDDLSTSVMERERFSIRTGPSGVRIEGVSDLALQQAAWTLLHHIGYRQFFPGETWEVVPKLERLAVDIEVDEKPDYLSRRIWYGFGFWDHNREAWEDWVRKNRMNGAFRLNTGHVYGQIIRYHQEVFDAHPEYYALIDGERKIRPHAKLCISNPGVREVAVQFALDFLEKNPDADSVSADPSDGGGWCECQECADIGSPSNRALLLANTMAEAVTDRFGGDRHVGMYAYGFHSPPPTLSVHPNVIVSAATGFIKGGSSVEEILAGWQKRGATTGIREYYSVSTWDRDLPGASRGSNLAYLRRTIPGFHSLGARHLSAESSDNWGCNGLGYYFASRVLWDITEADRKEEIVEDFLTKCFGPAVAPMREFYHRIDGENESARLVFEDLLARMFRLLSEARTLAGNEEAVRRRLDALVLYTRYAELHHLYRSARGEERQAAYEDMIRHAYRMRGTFLVHSYALYRDVHRRDSSIVLPEEADWRVPEPNNPWKSSEPFTREEVEALLAGGIDSYEPVELDFEPESWDDLTLVSAKDIPSAEPRSPGKAAAGRGKRSFFAVVDQAPSTIELEVTGGLIAHYRDRGNVRIHLWKLGGASETGERETLVKVDETVPPDGVTRTIEFPVDEPGVYRIDVSDGRDMTTITWSEGQRISWKMALDDHPDMMTGRWYLYFFVPAGTKRIGIHSRAAGGVLLRPDGSEALELKTDGGGFLSAEVPPGMDGRLWKLHHVAGTVCLVNVPPFLARSSDELVLPRDVLED